MDAHRGFTLTEVLVSLSLFTSISLALLKQQWQIVQSLNQLSSTISNLISKDDDNELKFLKPIPRGKKGFVDTENA